MWQRMDGSQPLDNDRHERFAHEYVRDLNATRAYIRSGYSTGGAEASASKLLANRKVSCRVAFLKAEALAAIKADHLSVARQTARIAYHDVRQVVQWRDGRVDLTDSADLDDDTAAAIQSIETDKDGNIKIKFYDRQKSLDMLAKWNGMFKESEDRLGGGAAAQTLLAAIQGKSPPISKPGSVEDNRPEADTDAAS